MKDKDTQQFDDPGPPSESQPRAGADGSSSTLHNSAPAMLGPCPWCDDKQSVSYQGRYLSIGAQMSCPHPYHEFQVVKSVETVFDLIGELLGEPHLEEVA